MDEKDVKRKKTNTTPSVEQIKTLILEAQEPLVFKHLLSWDLLNWSLDDWIEKLGNRELDLRTGPKACSKHPKWENNCKVVSATPKDLLDNKNHRLTDSWMYFDYKHMKNYFKNKIELLESVSWADFGFPDKSGKDSTIWIGTQGAYTPCHMDSYGCNIVAQVYGKKLWIMFPPEKTSVLKPTRIPYEESSIYSEVNFSCGLNINHEIGEARVIELLPGDVLIVPKHWWHYVENLTTAISINMWIPMESDHTSRLEESLVRFFVASTLKTMDIEGETSLLNPNEMDMLDETVDIRQISWCLDQVLKQKTSDRHISFTSPTSESSCLSVVPLMAAVDLRNFLLKKCGCVLNDDCSGIKTLPLAVDHVINAFCHPDVIAKVTEILITARKT